MNRILVSLGAAVLISSAVYAQSYPDVPTGHWAYDAVTELTNDGIVKGYPDGTFKGNRALTRYEFAIAIRDAVQTLKGRLAALEAAKPVPAPSVVNETKVVTDPHLAEELTKLSADNEKLLKLSVEFQDELSALGVDTESLKKDNTDLQKRVSAIEAGLDKLKIGADVNFIIKANQNFSGTHVADLNGVATNGGGLLSNVDVLHDLTLNLDAKLSDAATGSAAILVSNYLPYLNGSASKFVGYNHSPNTDIAIWKAAVDVPISLFGKTADLTIGRYGNQINPFILRRTDNDQYVNLSLYDDGNYSTDGAKLSADFGSLTLGLFAGKNNTVKSNNNTYPAYGQFQALNNYNNLELTQSAGATLGYKLNDKLSLNAAYAAFGYDSQLVGPRPTETNRLEVFGAGLSAKDLVKGLNLHADFAQSNLNKNDVQKENSQNYVISAGTSYAVNDNVNLSLGYLEVQPNYAAPGYWGRVGSIINPRGVKGPNGSISWNTGKFGVALSGGRYETIRTTAGTPAKIDDLAHIDAKLSYAVNPDVKLGVDYETVVWNQNNLGYTPTQSSITLTSNVNLAQNTALRLLYQVIDVRSASSNTASIFGNAGTSGTAVTQLSVKF